MRKYGSDKVCPGWDGRDRLKDACQELKRVIFVVVR
jgi:hypothetical protein